MKIAIIEICEPNHYFAVEALALTYAVSINNQIVIFATKLVAQHFHFHHSNIEVQIVDENLIGANLKNINNLGFQRIHINTIANYYEEFASIKIWQAEVILTIHNIETWFDNRFIKRISLLNHRILKNDKPQYHLKQDFYLPIKYFFKDIKLQKLKNQIIENIKINKHKYLVYGENQKDYLKKLGIISDLVVFPFCVHLPSTDLSLNNLKLRVCIPGSVDNLRRDYTYLFKLLNQNIALFKSKMELDLLGFIPKSNQYLIEEIEKLKSSGLNIIYSENFIDEIEYENRLNSCDIILGNLKVNLTNQSKYGETKETGVIFNMIKAGKPGIFPSEYFIPKDLLPICKTYTNDLVSVLRNLIDKSDELQTLKNNAKIFVKNYEPAILYPVLIN